MLKHDYKSASDYRIFNVTIFYGFVNCVILCLI